ncbi:MAG: redoxin domain-containing protein [candidate division Zixibacteria bacterium]|nr:redoxin domain-containing protein [candidate division Zixibacteria bacterium]
MSIQVGKNAPEFSGEAVVPGGEFKNIKLSDYKGKWVVLFFYPLDFTFVCPTEITSFNKHYNEFKEAGAEVIGASIDSVFSHLAWINNGLGKLDFPLLSDITKTISRDYGILLEDQGVALRGTFIIDPDGKLRSAVVNDTNTGRNVAETLRTMKAMQTGELTPCGWNPGEDTLGKA